jgi:uncharacterized protein with HEPN domain
MNSYERLDAWQAAHRLVLLIYRTTQSFPPEERALVRLVRDLHLISEAQWQELETLRDQVGRLTWGLYASMRRAIARSE